LSKLKKDFFHPSFISPTMSSSTIFNQPSIEAVQMKKKLSNLNMKRDSASHMLSNNFNGNIKRDDNKLEELSKIYAHDNNRPKSSSKNKRLGAGEEKFRFLHR
jgi:hypothetical protein